MELAMTGKAFAELNRSESMVQLLFYARIFARFSPEQKAGLSACTSINYSSPLFGLQLPNRDGGYGRCSGCNAHALRY